jgi:hypothetical protein
MRLPGTEGEVNKDSHVIGRRGTPIQRETGGLRGGKKVEGNQDVKECVM